MKRHLLCVLLCCLPLSPVAGQEETTGKLELVVMVVSSELDLKPVPKWGFIVESSGSVGELREISTGFDGKAEIELPAGHYEVRSLKPLVFEGSELTWKRLSGESRPPGGVRRRFRLWPSFRGAS